MSKTMRYSNEDNEALDRVTSRSKWKHGSFQDDPHQRFRGGKTELEHKNGTHKARFANRAARVQWQQGKQSASEFPGRNR